eukprot:jgi/Mesen1/2405/ME000157S01537
MAPQVGDPGSHPGAPMKEQLELSPSGKYIDASEMRLRELGYKQELKRQMTLVELFGVSASVMNPYITIVPFYAIALSYGGPQNVMWPWWPVVFFSLCVGLNLSEICSSFPTTGSLYFWAASMCPPRWRSLVSWMTAWLEVTAVIVGNASVAFPAAQLIQQIIVLMSGGYNGGGYYASKGVFFAIFAALEISWALINSFSVKWVSKFLEFYVWFNLLYTVTLIIVLPAVARTHQDAEYVYTHYEDSAFVTGVSNVGVNFLFAMLLPQFCFFGYDAAAHITEEALDAAVAGPRAIMGSIVVEAVLGYALLNAFTFSIQGYWGDLFDPANATGGKYPVAQLMYDVFHGRYGSGTGAYVLLILMVIPFYASGIAGTMAASRAVYAVSRDKAMPLSFLWSKLNASKIPVNALWLVVTIAICLGLPNFGSTVAFNAIASVATTAWVGTYGVAILFRLVMKDENFKRGPFHLGAFSKPIGVLSLAYIVYTMVIFMVPLTYPVTWNNFNYGPISFGTVMVLAFSWWLVDARNWFNGPIRNVEGEDSAGVGPE